MFLRLTLAGVKAEDCCRFLRNRNHGIGAMFFTFDGRAGRRDLLSPPGRFDSLRDRPNYVDRWTRWPGVWIAGPQHPRR
jgi:hypothetical protein